MNSTQFDALVAKLEPYAEANPKGYKFKVGFLAYLGYAYLFFVITALLGVSGALIVMATLMPKAATIKLALKLGLPLLVLSIMAIRSLWVRLDPPEGEYLLPEQAPKLFETLRQYEKELDTKPIHHVIIDNDFNCGISQVPAMGLIGFNKNYLILGLPMMQAIKESELKAILAHELGHLSGNHSSFSAWIYRVRQTWSILLTRLYENESWGSFMFEKFFSWYSPYFAAYSFVLARSNEYEADACSVQLTSKRTTADALVNTSIKGEYLSRHFWKNVYEKAKVSALPPNNIYTVMEASLAKGVSPEEAKASLDASLKLKTTTGDTHPCLVDRIKALDIPLQEVTYNVAKPMEESAADYFLGDYQGTLKERFNTEWASHVRDYWEHLHTDFNDLSQKIHDFQQKEITSGGMLTDDERYDYAVALMDYSGQKSAVSVLENIVKTSPSYHKAYFTLGSILLAEDNHDGVRYMLDVMDIKSRYIIPCCEDLYGFYYRQGQMEDANKYLQKLEAHEEHIEKAENEAIDFKPKDTFIPHDLDQKEQERLTAIFSEHPDVKAVYIAKKILKFDPDYPVYLFCVERHKKLIEFNGNEKSAELQYELMSIPCPTASFFLIANSSFGKSMLKPLKKIENSCLYQE